MPSITPRRGAVLLAVLVIVSAALRLAAAQSIPGPFIAPDEMIYALLGRSLWSTGHLSILGADTPYYSLLYPAIAGLPLSLGDLATGFTLLQGVQAVLVSLTGVVVYVWGRRFLTPGWALVAAALSLTPPALAYSGLVMSEALFLPLLTVAAWMLARALERPTPTRQALLGLVVACAVLTRLQAVVLVPVAVTAILLDAALARDRRLLREWLPTAAALGALTLGWLAWRASAGSWSGVFGAYSAAIGGYDAGEAARFVAWHAGDLFLVAAGLPLFAMVALLVDGIVEHRLEPAERALVATAVSLAGWLVLEVGVFASQHVLQLAERDLVGALPPLFLGFSLWLSSGAPRPQPWTAIAVLAAALPALLLPLDRFVTLAAAPDAFMTIPLQKAFERWGHDRLELLWLVGIAVLVAAFLLIPRRLAPALAVAAGLMLALCSVSASREVGRLAQDSRHRFFGGGDPSWVDAATNRPVTLLWDGSAYWVSVWHQLLWNERIRTVVTLPGLPVPGPVPQREIAPRFDGILFGTDGRPVDDPAVVAPTVFAFRGDRVAAIAQQDIDRAGLALWRAPPPARLASWITDIQPNGDFTTARVTVYACPPGRLEVTLLKKSDEPVLLRSSGATVGQARFGADGVWNGSIPAPPTADGRTACDFELASAGLVGSTRIEYVAS